MNPAIDQLEAAAHACETQADAQEADGNHEQAQASRDYAKGCRDGIAVLNGATPPAIPVEPEKTPAFGGN